MGVLEVALRKIGVLILVLLIMSLGWSSIAFADDSPTVVNLENQHLQATVLSNQVNLRSGPGQNYAVVARVRQGLRLPVLRNGRRCEWLVRS